MNRRGFLRKAAGLAAAAMVPGPAIEAVARTMAAGRAKLITFGLKPENPRHD